MGQRLVPHILLLARPPYQVLNRQFRHQGSSHPRRIREIRRYFPTRRDGRARFGALVLETSTAGAVDIVWSSLGMLRAHRFSMKRETRMRGFSGVSL